MEFKKKFKAQFLILSLFYIVFGIALFVWTNPTLVVIKNIIVAFLLVYGIFQILGSLVHKKQTGLDVFGLVLGILITLMGVLILFNPIVFLVIPILIGISIVVDSLIKAQWALALKKHGDRYWWITLLLSIILLIIGVIMAIFPLFGFEVIIFFIAASLIADGILNIIVYFAISKALKKAQA